MLRFATAAVTRATHRTLTTSAMLHGWHSGVVVSDQNQQDFLEEHERQATHFIRGLVEHSEAARRDRSEAMLRRSQEPLDEMIALQMRMEATLKKSRETRAMSAAALKESRETRAKTAASRMQTAVTLKESRDARAKSAALRMQTAVTLKKSEETRAKVIALQMQADVMLKELLISRELCDDALKQTAVTEKLYESMQDDITRLQNSFADVDAQIAEIERIITGDKNVAIVAQVLRMVDDEFQSRFNSLDSLLTTWFTPKGLREPEAENALSCFLTGIPTSLRARFFDAWQSVRDRHAGFAHLIDDPSQLTRDEVKAATELCCARVGDDVRATILEVVFRGR